MDHQHLLACDGGQDSDLWRPKGVSGQSVCLNCMPYRLQTFSPDRPSSACDVITLKVKSEDGNHTYILKMCLSETIGHLRQHLDKHRWVRPRPEVSFCQLVFATRDTGCLFFVHYRRGGLPSYDIISAYPQGCYNDDGQTLQSCGLTTNAALLLRKRQCPHSLTEVNKINWNKNVRLVIFY